MSEKVLVLFDDVGEVIVVISGDSYYLHNNAHIIADERCAKSWQFSYLDTD